jgi:hypothetical protein
MSHLEDKLFLKYVRFEFIREVSVKSTVFLNEKQCTRSLVEGENDSKKAVELYLQKVAAYFPETCVPSAKLHFNFLCSGGSSLFLHNPATETHPGVALDF